MASGMNRRTFLKTSAAAGFGVWVSSRANAQESKSPAEKLHIAVIGVQGRGKDNLKGVMKENIVALCDIDEKNLAGVVKEFKDLEPAQRYADWRKMLEQKDIDAVVVATPDHVHAHATIAAMQLGKHVYCEKPLTHSIWEARRMAEVAKQTKVMTQMGHTGHANEGTRLTVEMVRNGVIGDVKEIHTWTNRPIWPQGIERPQN